MIFLISFCEEAQSAEKRVVMAPKHRISEIRVCEFFIIG